MAEKYELTKAELKLLSCMRKVEYGEIVVVVRDGKPVELSEVRQSMMIERGNGA